MKPEPPPPRHGVELGMVEHPARDREVVGPNPTAPIKNDIVMFAPLTIEAIDAMDRAAHEPPQIHPPGKRLPGIVVEIAPQDLRYVSGCCVPFAVEP